MQEDKPITGLQQALLGLAFGLLFLFAIIGIARAQDYPVPPYFKGGTVSPVTVTSTSAMAIPANPHRQYLAIDNESSTATIACSFGGTAALNTAGSFTFTSGTTRVWNSVPVPTEQVNCISSASTSPATVETN